MMYMLNQAIKLFHSIGNEDQIVRDYAGQFKGKLGQVQ